MEMIPNLNLVPINSVEGHTFIRGKTISKIDFAFCDSVTFRCVESSRVLNLLSDLDHRYILYTLRTDSLREN